MSGVYFQDEFEHEANNGKTYYIEVEGTHYDDEDGTYVEISNMVFSDDDGNTIDRTDDVYSELVDAVDAMDFEVENHYTDNSFFGDHEDLAY